MPIVFLISASQLVEDGELLVGPPDPVAGCEEQLKASNIRYRPSSIAVHWNGSRSFQCGAPQVVRYQSGPGSIKWQASPKTSCPLALAMARFERIVQEEAAMHFSRRVVRVMHAGTYNCREMSAYPGWVSEHSYANAIDVSEFRLDNGTQIRVGRDYRADSPKGRFLRRVARRSYDESVFSVVLTPNFDGLHRHHLHLDVARYRVDGT